MTRLALNTGHFPTFDLLARNIGLLLLFCKIKFIKCCNTKTRLALNTEHFPTFDSLTRNICLLLLFCKLKFKNAVTQCPDWC